MTSNLNYINSQYYNKYSKYLKNYNPNNNTHTEGPHVTENGQKNNYAYNNTPTVQKNVKSKENKKINQNIFGFNFEHINILGIDLFSDDILLILIIYFLYTEGVKDIYLFIVLILLLLS